MGKNTHGQLGMGDTNDRQELEQNALIENEMRLNKDLVSFVACGARHTLFLTQKGFVYGCGDASSHAFAMDESTDTPKRIRFFDSLDTEGLVEWVACGSEHSLFLMRNKVVLVCGSNENGLCNVAQDVLKRPTECDLFHGDSVKHFGMFVDYQVFSTENDYLYVFGYGAKDIFAKYISYTIPNVFNYDFVDRGVKSITCCEAMCFVKDRSNVWHVFYSKSEKGCITLDEFIKRNMSTIAHDFSNGLDTCVGVTQCPRYAMVLTMRGRLIVIEWSTVNQRQREFKFTQIKLENVGMDLGSLELEIGMLNGVPIVYPVSGRDYDTDICSDHKRMMKNLLDFIPSDGVIGKRGKGSISKTPFTDLSIEWSVNDHNPYKKQKM